MQTITYILMRYLLNEQRHWFT